MSKHSSSTASAYQWNAGSGYRSDGFGPTNALPLMKVGARYYDAQLGRFITRDTDLSQSPYAYCDGDPVNCTDPTGHDDIPTIPQSQQQMQQEAGQLLQEGMQTQEQDEQQMQQQIGQDMNTFSSLVTGALTGGVTKQGTTTTTNVGVTLTHGGIIIGGGVTNTSTPTSNTTTENLSATLGIGRGGTVTFNSIFGGKMGGGGVVVKLPFQFNL